MFEKTINDVCKVCTGECSFGDLKAIGVNLSMCRLVGEPVACLDKAVFETSIDHLVQAQEFLIKMHQHAELMRIHKAFYARYCEKIGSTISGVDEVFERLKTREDELVDVQV